MPASPYLATLPELGPFTSSCAQEAAISATSSGSAAWVALSAPGRPMACCVRPGAPPELWYRAAGVLRGASALGSAAHILSAAAST